MELSSTEVGTMRVAVAGGTGTVGRHLVAALSGAGHRPVVLTRSTGVDLGTGAGLDAALEGADAVVDVSNVSTTLRAGSVRFFGAATEHLLAAGRRAGVGHHVVLSILGIDRVDYGYYAGKRLQEELVLAGPIPATVLRATQFHEFPGQLLERLRGPVAVLPRMRVQPVAAREVAEALVGLLVAGPDRTVSTAGTSRPLSTWELAGPEVADLADLARRLLRARGERRAVLEVRLPGAAGQAMAGGGLLPQPAAGPAERTASALRGLVTFDEWLAEQASNGWGAAA